MWGQVRAKRLIAKQAVVELHDDEAGAFSGFTSGESVTQDCPFCNFEDLEAVFYEDAICFAIISRRPINSFHTLVVPREHFIDFTDLPDEIAAHIFLVSKRISEALRKACNPDAVTHISDDDIYRKGYNLAEHYKFHIIPRFDDDNVRIDWGRTEDPGSAARVGYAKQIKALL